MMRTVILLCGLPASGKTTTARRIHAHTGGTLIRQCDVYQDLGIDLPAWVRRTNGLTRGVRGYEEVRAGAYDELTRRLRAALDADREPVIVDAVHAERARRLLACSLAAGYDATPVILWCRCDVNETRRRMADRQGHESEPENEAAHFSVYQHLAGLWDDPLADDFEVASPVLLAHDTIADRLDVLRGASPAIDLIRAALGRPVAA